MHNSCKWEDYIIFKATKMKTINILIGFGLVIILLTSCEMEKDCIYGSGSIVEKHYSISDFNQLSINGSADVFLTKDTQTTLRIEGQENVLNALKVEVSSGELSIGRDNCFKEIKKLKVYVSTPNLSGVKIAGVCNVCSSGIFSGAGFYAEIEGSGEMNLNIDVDDFTAIISGQGDIFAVGKATSQTFRISGTGDMNCFELKGTEADINIDGMGQVEVHVSEELEVNISGSADIYYMGTPNITRNISGTGNIINVFE